MNLQDIKTITFTSPIEVMVPRKTKPAKRVALNLNVYRNLHYQVNNHAKVIYRELMADQLRDVMPAKEIITLEFIHFKGSRRIMDRSNVLSVVEKFFCDALVHYRVIPDDNDQHIRSTIYSTGGIDRQNPHVKVVMVCR